LARVLLVDLLAMAGREVTLWMNFERDCGHSRARCCVINGKRSYQSA
jgi:hypothetical protein